MSKKTKRPTKGEGADCSDSRWTTQRAELKQEGAATKAKKARVVIKIPSPGQQPWELRSISGSANDDFTQMLGNQVAKALWHDHSDSDEQMRQIGATLVAMIGMKPGDELEGMLIGQLIASHNAAMECYRRAMLAPQAFETRMGNLNQANKLSRTYTALVEALDRHRGKGQQRITVEHVNVHAGGQAIVGAVTPGGSSQKLEEPTDAPRGISHEPGTPMRSADAQWETVPITRGARKAAV